MSRPCAHLVLRVYTNGLDADSTLYQEQRMLPASWLSDSRYSGYATFEFQEMYEHMVKAVKGKL
jgi:hypothetical protein